jgi:hypothetical protein
MGITSYKFPITNFHSVWFFLLAQIFINAATIVLPFRQHMFVVSLSAGRRPAVMKVIAFQAKVSR